MRLAQVFLRSGCALTGWTVGLAYVGVLAFIPRAACVQGAGDPWIASTALGIAAAASSFLIPLGRPMGAAMRWLVVPLLVLVPFAALAVVPFLGAALRGGVHLCQIQSEAHPAWPAPGWHRLWAPFHLAVLLGLAGSALSLWMPQRARAPRVLGPPDS